MRDKMLDIVMAVGTMFVIVIVLLLLLVACKPSMPVKGDYAGNIPCYLADKCMTLNAYMINNKMECADALTKCYRYTDYEKCKGEKDFDKCWSDLGVRK